MAIVDFVEVLEEVPHLVAHDGGVNVNRREDGVGHGHPETGVVVHDGDEVLVVTERVSAIIARRSDGVDEVRRAEPVLVFLGHLQLKLGVQRQEELNAPPRHVLPVVLDGLGQGVEPIGMKRDATSGVVPD